MSKLSSFAALELAALRAKGYTAEQLATLSTALEEIFKEINESLETCEEHIESAHAPANAEENVIVSIKRNGKALPPTDKIVDMEVPEKTSDLTNDSGFTTEEFVANSVKNAGHLSSLVVEELPSASDAKANTIYHVRKNEGELGDQYTQHQLINGVFELFGAKQPNLSAYAQTKDVAKATDALVESIVKTQRASSESYIGTGNLALFWTLIQPYLGGRDLTELTARVRLLELVMLNEEIEGNPFYVTFDTLSGITATGVWNTQDQRIEF